MRNLSLFMGFLTLCGAADTAVAQQAQDFRLPPLATFTVMIDRQLFAEGRPPAAPIDAALGLQKTDRKPERRPAAAKKTKEAIEITFLETLLFSGLYRDSDGLHALIKDSRTNQTLRLSEGDTVNGWRVEGIRDGVLHLGAGEAAVKVTAINPRLPNRVKN